MIRIYADIVQNLHGTYKQTERGKGGSMFDV